jgi:hypothetical protein
MAQHSYAQLGLCGWCFAVGVQACSMFIEQVLNAALLLPMCPSSADYMHDVIEVGGSSPCHYCSECFATSVLVAVYRN